MVMWWYVRWVNAVAVQNILQPAHAKEVSAATALSSKVVKRLFSMFDTRQYLEKDACSNPGNLTAQMN